MINAGNPLNIPHSGIEIPRNITSVVLDDVLVSIQDSIGVQVTDKVRTPIIVHIHNEF